jgi:hypothetical protein
VALRHTGAVVERLVVGHQAGAALDLALVPDVVRLRERKERKEKLAEDEGTGTSDDVRDERATR